MLSFLNTINVVTIKIINEILYITFILISLWNFMYAYLQQSHSVAYTSSTGKEPLRLVAMVSDNEI